VRKIPTQFYIFAMVLLLYFWPWEFFSSSVFTVFTLQAFFVAICAKLVKESWVIPIIAIELIVALFNVTFFCMPSIPDDLHAQITLTAVIIELLIIFNSLMLGGAGDDSRWRVVDNGGLRRDSCGLHSKNFTGENP